MDAVENLYRTRSYWSLHNRDVLLTAVPCVVAILAMMSLSYDAVVKQLRSNWKDNRCSPVYLPFAGVILPQPGQSALDATIENFDYCIRRDLTGAFKMMLMPLEFVSFSILSVMDLLIEGMLLTMAMVAKLKNLLGSISQKIYSKIRAIMIPLVLFTAKIRDLLGKVNAVSMAAIFTTLTVYNTVVSGLLSLTTIIVDLLIAMAAVITGMFVTALVLMNPLTFPAGMALFALANGMLSAIFIPTVVIYAMLQTFMSGVFGKKARPAPAIPVGKMKDMGKGIGKGIQDLGKDIGKGAKDLGKDIGKAFGGKKKK